MNINSSLAINGRAKKATRAALKVASLNVRGFGNQSVNHPSDKWNHINQLIRDKKIGVLLVQEAHMTQERCAQLEDLFSRRMKIFFSENPENPTGKGGVAVVLNKHFVKAAETDAVEVVPGRALLVRLKWHGNRTLAVLAVYAPNEPGSNRDFWRKIEAYYIANPRTAKPDIMAGDCNMVEDVIDRLPMHSDRADVVDALDNLKSEFRLQDGWRYTYPKTKSYTFYQNNGASSQSRIDRIYVTGPILQTAREWGIETSGVPNADHRMVTVQVVNQNAPEIGKGRWSIPMHLLKDKPLQDYIHEKGRAAEKKLDAIVHRTEMQNAQSIYALFKCQVMEAARNRERAIVPKLVMKIRDCEEELGKINNDGDRPDEERACEAAAVVKKIAELERQRHLQKRTNVAVRDRLEGETISRYWTKVNKEVKPQDVIHALRKPGPVDGQEGVVVGGQYETKSKKMAELARDYHARLQEDGMNSLDPQSREESTHDALRSIKVKTTDEQQAYLAANVTEEDVVAALKSAQSEKAAGIDGITYEVWKSLHKRHLDDEKNGKPAFNVIRLMTAVFNDIEMYGVEKSTNFAEGWMCPMYKKNDPNEIANYRPLTMLNTDYKIFTKVIATKLAKAAPTLLHESQAGFVPGRKIVDQTKLIEVMIDYAEAAEQNGIIVALDQEKAYDKIAHDYLWRVLGRFGIPESLVNTIKALYQSAETRVMLNGHLSSKFKVIRGVRQGDPMSCLLFDLAIEPLAAMLRQSEIKGYSIPGAKEKLIANLFADDTTTFLSEGDSFNVLQTILQRWCTTSTAKFNTQKTEIIPIGKPEYRSKVLETRQISEGQEKIPEQIHISKDGEAVRILDAWMGNGVSTEDVWSRC